MTSFGLRRTRVGMAVFAALFLFVSLCAQGASGQSQGARIERTIKQSGLNREYIAYLPANPGARSSWPVLMAFHPAFATATDFERIAGFQNARGAQNFIVVYPNGFRRSWNVGKCCGGAQRRGLDDLGFFSAIMADLNTIVPVEPRAYVTGFSNGAMLAYALACKRSNSIAAVAPSGATIALSNQNCNPGRPIPVFHLHGREDTFAPFSGGQSEFKRVGKQPAVTDGIAFMAKENRCTQKSQTTQPSGVTCTNWRGCPKGGEVTLCVVPGLGHLWAGSRSKTFGNLMGLGPSRTDISATNQIVQFFLSHR
ncbi:alpha/beta hydrolase family esterase [Sulfitobacter sp. JB4-11]|uniref:alpha/beta hydrolase family esterase n=1 Tax=Sulfitobacter rhodophyticola TaxID=3238304 RepID=UPI003518241A